MIQQGLLLIFSYAWYIESAKHAHISIRYKNNEI